MPGGESGWLARACNIYEGSQGIYEPWVQLLLAWVSEALSKRGGSMTLQR